MYSPTNIVGLFFVDLKVFRYISSILFTRQLNKVYLIIHQAPHTL